MSAAVALLAALATALATVSTAAAQAPGPPVEVRRDVSYGAANGKSLLLDAYIPAGGTGTRPAVVLIHGGGWRSGDKPSYAEEAGKLAGMGWVAFSVNYRLDERPTFTAGIEDVQAAVRWVRAHAREFDVDPQRIGVLGESAGGHLAAMLATLGNGPLDRGSRVRVAAAWSGPMDLAALARSRGEGWAVPMMGCTIAACPDRWARVSPVTHVDGSDAPTFLVNSTEELVPLSQAQAMAQRLKAAGVDHQLDVLPGRRHAMDFRADAWPNTVRFLQKHLEAGPGSVRQATDDDGDLESALVAGVTGGALLAAGGMAVARRRRRAVAQADSGPREG